MNKLALLAFFGLLFLALFGERIAPYEQIYYVVEHGRDPRPFDPGVVFPLGSDVLGRDLFSVVLAGARATLTIVVLGGLARVLSGLVVAALGMWWSPFRLLTETLADFVGAVPATLVAVIVIKAFVKVDTTIPVVIGALLLVGWAGPYRVIRAEGDRLARMPFTEGARAMGATRWRLLWRHHLPHLAPVIATNLSQQIVAALVLMAELGVVGVVLSTVRSIDVQESLSIIRTGPPNQALVPDTPEWGAMLSSARTVEILWATRWIIFVPGAAFALTSMAVAVTGFALARRYLRRDILKDIRGAALIGAAAAVLFVASGFVPERYADAREWATSARAALTHAPSTQTAFEGAGLRTYSVSRDTTVVSRAGKARVTIAGTSVDELFRPREDPQTDIVHVRSLVSDGLGGGGVVEAPLVFAARGIVPADILQPPAYQRQRDARSGPALYPLIQGYPDDYAGIDVRGKVVLLVRFMGVDTG
ncbi:MAG: ABC transporter permease subunit, partial [Chloroflexota bacterium]|nr:ABC transporter permease subunit [Chloroflexota bacterium]